MSPFLSLNRFTLNGLADALETRRLTLPVSLISLSNYIPDPLQQSVTTEINRLHQQGMTGIALAFTLRLLVEERRLTQEKQHLGVVWTGPEIAGSEGRDTAIVVRQMFSQAQHNVLISSFAIDEGPKGQELFRPLAKRMGERPDLQVRMFLNVKRKYTDTKPSSLILREFAEIFRNQIWPGVRLPEVFYDPRSLEPSSNTNACLHAKCVVIDEEKLLVTSANFTEAAHLRNIEAGILVENRSAARAIRSQFEMLVSIGLLRKIPGI
ncbi:MAG: phospholipase [Synechococcaceae cyanobacterium SM2_3_2]|nr:phospholipase [Synechococcaceae cyanobacterium SM2_3_2]